MLAPTPRYHKPPSITSTAQSATSTSSYMRPGGASTSTSTSVFSDDGTEIPRSLSSHQGGLTKDERNKTPPLIDLEDDGVRLAVTNGRREETPGDKLRLLLRQMEAEVRNAVPVVPAPVQRSPEQQRSSRTWRNGRRRILEGSASIGSEGSSDGRRSLTPVSSPERGRSEEEEESPPTPPPRITNPYSSRRVPSDSRSTPTGRIPSRAAILQASASRSTPPSSPSKRLEPKTPLETFLHSHPKIPTIPIPLYSSPPRRSPMKRQSGSPSGDSPGSVSPPSRKGKERASLSSVNTPRQRTTVDDAPETSASFLQGLEERDEVDLDISEGMTWDEEMDESVNDNEEELPPVSDEESMRHDRTAGRNSTGSKTNRFSPLRGRQQDTLPALPEPDLVSDGNDEEDESRINRRRSFFRSPSKTTPSPGSRSGIAWPTSNSRLDESTMDNATSTKQILKAPAEADTSSSFRTIPLRDTSIRHETIQVGMVLTPFPAQFTPTKATSSANTSMSSPKPPGGWKFTPSALRHAVRFPSSSPTPSPSASAGREDKSRLSASGQEGEEEISVHRVWVSPVKVQAGDAGALGRSPLRRIYEGEEENGENDKSGTADTSLSGRLKGISRALTGLPKQPPQIPDPSQTFHQASQALLQASEATSTAREKLEKSQKEWLEAISSISFHTSLGDVSVGDVGVVVRKGWGWGNWSWWFVVEVLLIWSVFRLTLDYATSTTYLSTFDPFHPSSQLDPSRLSISLPVLEVFRMDHRATSNLFDLIERLDLWRRMSAISGLIHSGDGRRVISGIPS